MKELVRSVAVLPTAGREVGTESVSGGSGAESVEYAQYDVCLACLAKRFGTDYEAARPFSWLYEPYVLACHPVLGMVVSSRIRGLEIEGRFSQFPFATWPWMCGPCQDRGGGGPWGPCGLRFELAG